MLSNNKIKYLNTLQVKKSRQKYKNFIAEGDKIGSEIINNSSLVLEEIFTTREWLQNHKHEIEQYKDCITEVTDAELKKISALSTPNQVLIVAKQQEFEIDPELLKKELVLYLDGIQDPGNMGTLLRIADWFGIPYVFCSDTCVDVYNPKVIQATMGAFLRVKTKEVSLTEIITENIPVYGALLDGENIFDQNLSNHGIIVIGNEGNGISSENLEKINHPIRIPAFAKGAESLNAAVATGIICALFRNQKQ
ncbi:MAG: TrmH family RNA methyltransferase [Saprospiraceae bacterium]